MGTMDVVYFVPLTPLIPLAFYLKGVVCTDVANWKSPYKVESWWPQGNKDAIIGNFLLDSVSSLHCASHFVASLHHNPVVQPVTKTSFIQDSLSFLSLLNPPKSVLNNSCSMSVRRFPECFNCNFHCS